MRVRRSMRVGAFAMVMGLAACGGGKSNHTNAGGTPATTAAVATTLAASSGPDACSLLTAEAAGALVGHAVTRDADSPGKGVPGRFTVSQCAWTTGDLDPSEMRNATTRVRLKVDTFTSSEMAASTYDNLNSVNPCNSPTRTSVSGIGDAASATTCGNGLLQSFNARAGKVVVEFEFSGPASPSLDAANPSLATIVSRATA